VYNENSQQPTANSQQPTANSQQPTANSQQPTANSQQPNTEIRNYFDEIDFTKGMLIILMVIFHLRYVGIFEEQFNNLKTLVYVFHMPGFLVLSGFLTNFNKPIKIFFIDNCRKILIPLLLFEFLYIFALNIVQKFGIETSNHVENMNIISICKYLFISPTGTYWYLHTLILCNVLYYVCQYLFKNNEINTIIVFSIILYIFSLFTGLSINNGIFYIIGILLKIYNNKYFMAIKASLLSIIMVVIIAYITLPTLDRFSLYGIVITYLMLSFFLSIYGYMKKKNFFIYLGKNSYAFVLFSPLFTVLCSLFLKYFVRIDKTGILYIISATILTVAGSLFVSYFVTKIKMSWLLGAKQFYKPYKT
jgi:fucose 4-O-acetylase-like acetyltransferase